MFKTITTSLALVFTLSGCNTTSKDQEQKKVTIDSVAVKQESLKDSVIAESICVSDSLNAIANIISGIKDSTLVPYSYIQFSSDFKAFSKNFDKRWMAFDSSRLANLKLFKEKEVSQVIKPQATLFYPFSGPDILYAQTFFPEADQYVMIGLEPVGSLPQFNEHGKDSLDTYFSKVNTSLNAILKFSFFRTQSMKNDLHNAAVDGTLHLLFLFLKRTGNQLCSTKPVTVDSLGHVIVLNSFTELKKISTPTKGIEIKFSDINHKAKTLYYFSLNAADGGLKPNKGFVTYLNQLGTFNTYLKGASYLMHKSYFTIIRDIILNQSEQVTQDDSGIALHYFTNSASKWKYSFYGQYLRPIPMFSGFYQKDLDSLYKQQGAKPIGFGIGYNFKDKNSNFMIATKKR